MRDNTDLQTDENKEDRLGSYLHQLTVSSLGKGRGQGKGVEEKVLGEYNLSTLVLEQKFHYKSLHSLQ